MAKVKVADFDLENIQALISNTAELKDNLDALKETNKQLKKDGEGASSAFVENAAAIKSLNSAYNANVKVLAEHNQKTADAAAREKLLTVALNQEVKSINDARASNKLLNKLRNETNTTTSKGRKELELLNKRLDANNKFIKENVDQYAQQKINIGNYTQSVKDALAQSTLFGRVQRTLTQVLGIGKPIYTALKVEILGIGAAYRTATASTQGYSAAQKAAAVATGLLNGALKLLKAALIATGIGAILVALGSLISFLTKTQRGADFVSKAMAALGAAFDVVIDRISQFGEGLFAFLSGDVVGGIDKMTTAFSGMGDEIAREVGLAYELEEAFQNIRDKEIGLITVQAERKKQIEELRLLAKDELTDLNKRAELLEQAGNLEKKILEDNLEIKKEDARISREQLALGESSREDIRADAELQAEVIELETQSLKLQRSIEAEKQGLLKRARTEQSAAFKASQAEAKKAIDLAIRESKTKLQIFIEENRELGKSVDEKVRIQERIRDERLAILQDEVEAGKKTVADAELEKLRIKSDFLDKQSDIVVDFADEELRIYLLNNQSRLEGNELLNSQLVEQEQARLDAIAEKEREFLATQLENGKISRIEYNEAINDIDTENRLAKQDLDIELEQQRRDKEAIDLQNQRAIDEERLQHDYDLTQHYLELERQAALEEAKKTGADVKLINQFYDQEEVKARRAVGQAKLDMAANVFGGLVDLLGKESAAGKAAAVAQAVINVAQGVTKAIADGGLLGIVTGAIVAAAGAVSIGKIVSTKKPDLPSKQRPPKLAKGGALKVLGGKRHSAGGTKFQGEDGTAFEAEKGEIIGVMSRTAAKHFLAFNGAFGGRSSGSSSYLQAGGAVARTITNNTGPTFEDVRNLILESQQNIRVVNVATETEAAIVEHAIIVENASV